MALTHMETAMKSPFPGMDPYLEEHWRDVHHSFLTYARDELQQLSRTAPRPSDVDAPLDLQLLIDRCYHNGRYDDLNYRVDPNPPLDSDDAPWAIELLAAKGLR
jgi:hypothetical protein